MKDKICKNMSTLKLDPALRLLRGEKAKDKNLAIDKIFIAPNTTILIGDRECMHLDQIQAMSTEEIINLRNKVKSDGMYFVCQNDEAIAIVAFRKSATVKSGASRNSMVVHGKATMD